MQLDKNAFGLANGITWGLCIFLATVWVLIRGGGEHLILLNQFYIGYEISWLGGLIGLVYGFVTGYICGWIFATLNNVFVKPKS